MGITILVVQTALFLLTTIVALWLPKGKAARYWFGGIAVVAFIGLLAGIVDNRHGAAAQRTADTERAQAQSEIRQMKKELLEKQDQIAEYQRQLASKQDVLVRGQSSALLDSARKNQISDELAKFVASGTEIRNNCTPSIEPRRQQWTGNVTRYLHKNLGPAYEERFKTITIPGLICFQQVSAQIAVLDDFIKELRR